MKLLSRTTERARRVAERVTDPELPMLSLADLGVLSDVEVVGDSHVVVDITPTYSGCPAMAAMRDDLVRELTGAGFDRVEVRVSLDPAWTTDWITPAGRAALAAAGISPPGPAPSSSGPIPLSLLPTARQVRCPPGEQLTLSVPAQRSAMRLYVNGQLAASQGEPASTPRTLGS